MTTLDTQITVGQLVADNPSRSRVFEKLGIDYCCGGKKPLAEACRGKQLDPETVVRMLEVIDTMGNDTSSVDAGAMSLTQLCDHIEQTHHAYLREEFPRLDFMTRKVAATHGDAEPRLNELRNVFLAFQEELASHMMKEEHILFPMIRQLDRGQAHAAFHCGSIANPIAQMEHEHDSAGDALAKFHALTDGYSPPQWACNTFRAMYDALAHLESDMHQHVHKENNILFSKALKLEHDQRPN